MFRKGTILFCTIIQLFIVNCIQAQADSILYSFFIAGHTYGKPGVNNIGLHPPFKAKFPYIKSRPEIKFGFFLGDIVPPGWDSLDLYQVESDIDSLGLPIYFAVGNHDMENRELFESRYGPTYYHFKYNNDLFIVLDPNIDGWNISGDQMLFLLNVINSNYQYVDNIFVLFHQILWRENDNIYSVVSPNSFAGRTGPINFWPEIEPLFHTLPNKVVFCAGDLGAAYWSSDFCYDSYDNITFIGSGMGESIGDNFVILNITINKTLSYELICLNDTVLKCFGELESYKITNIENNNLIKIFPIPAKEYLHIVNNSKKTYSFQLYNYNGKLIIGGQLEINEEIILDIENFVSGIYIMNFGNDGRQQYSKRIIIQ